MYLYSSYHNSFRAILLARNTVILTASGKWLGFNVEIRPFSRQNMEVIPVCFSFILVSCISLYDLFNIDACMHAKSLQSHMTLYDPIDCRIPSSSVHGILQARIWSALPFPTPGDLLDPGIEPTLHISPALADGFFTIWTTRVAFKF